MRGLIVAILTLACFVHPITCDQDTTLPKYIPIINFAIVFSLVAFCCGVGGYYYKTENSQNLTLKVFLLGGSCVSVYAMSLSLSSSFITAIEVLGNPAEMHRYGTMFCYICLSFIFVVPITIYFYLPVFMQINVTSCYEYLELRFSKPVRLLGSSLFVCQTTLYTSVAVFGAAMSLTNVIGINRDICIILVYLVCAFYSTMGGLRAVIITDSIQAAVLVISMLFVLICGFVFIGDYQEFLNYLNTSGRLEFNNFSADMTERHSFWAVVIGGSFYWVSMFCVNQASIQRYLSVSKISEARKALWFAGASLIGVYLVSFMIGLTLSYFFRNCDPIKSGIITEHDQLLPYYVVTIMGKIPGAVGLVVAGILAASLGTVAAALTSISAVVMEDFGGIFFKDRIQELNQAKVAKYISAVAATISFCLVYVVKKFKSILELTITFNGVAGGINLGLFSLGMFFPRANAKGALAGGLTAFFVVGSIGTISLYYTTQGLISYETKPVSTNNCSYYNGTSIDSDETLENLKEENDIHVLFKLSYFWYTCMGYLITIVVGLLVSYCTKPTDVKTELISPPILSLCNKLEKKFNMKFNFVKTETNNIPTTVVEKYTRTDDDFSGRY